MREAGISVVRLAEFAWCRMEPGERRYDFDWLDRALAILHHEGIRAVLGTPTAAPPAWLHERYPDIYPADARQYRLGFGTRLQRCLNNDIMRAYARRVTEAMAEHFGGNPAVIGWQIDNEFEANLCYCEVCADKFRQWLRQKHGTLEALNRTWGAVFWSQEYGAWSQIPLPWEARCGQAHNPSLFLDYRRFASESTVSFQREQVAIIRRLAPGHFITHNLRGLHDSLDYFQLAADLDFVSWDNYPSGFWETETIHPGLAHDVMRGIKGRSFWVMEEQSGITAWEVMGQRPAPGQIRAWAWQAVGHGADAVLFFRWRSCPYGAEQLWQGILGHDGQPRRRYQEAAQFGQEMRKLSPALDGSAVRNEAAILNSYEQNWALQIQPQADGLGWWEQTKRLHHSLSRLGVNLDVVPISASLAQYRLVMAPSWYVLDEADAGRLAEFVRAGGILVLSPRTGVKTASNTCHLLPLPALLRDVAGLEVDDYAPLGAEPSLARLATGEEFAVFTWADALSLRGAEAVAVYGQPPFAGETAVARHRYGQGLVYYFGTFGEQAFYDTLFDRVLSEAGVARLPRIPAGVDAIWREKEGQRYLFLINLTGDGKTVPVPAGLTALLGDGPGADGVDLPAYGVAIFKT